jgi:rubrerythrin
MFTIFDIIDLAIQIEENGEAFYRRAILSISDPKLAETLEWLAEEEVAHAQWFADMRTRADRSVEDPQVARIGRALLRETVSENPFSLADTDVSEIDRTQSLIARSVTFEQDTVLFYEMLEPFMSGDADRRLLADIIEQEHRHIERLQALLKEDR